MGKCSGGLFDEHFLVFFNQETVRDKLSRDERLISAAFYDREGSFARPFIIGEDNNVFYILQTTSDKPDRVIRADKNNPLFADTGMDFDQFLIWTLKTKPASGEMCSGDLLAYK